MPSDTRPDRLSESSVRAMFQALTPEETVEFSEGFAKHAHLMDMDPSPENARAFTAFVRSWVVSAALYADPEWQRQVAAPSDPDDEPVDAAGLRKLLGV